MDGTGRPPAARRAPDRARGGTRPAREAAILACAAAFGGAALSALRLTLGWGPGHTIDAPPFVRAVPVGALVLTALVASASCEAAVLTIRRVTGTRIHGARALALRLTLAGIGLATWWDALCREAVDDRGGRAVVVLEPLFSLAVALSAAALLPVGPRGARSLLSGTLAALTPVIALRALQWPTGRPPTLTDLALGVLEVLATAGVALFAAMGVILPRAAVAVAERAARREHS